MERTHQVSEKEVLQTAGLRKLRDVLPAALKKKMYNALVLPHLDYCSVVRQECAKSLQLKVEQTQNYGMRLVLSKLYRTPSEEMRRSLQWTTLVERRRRSRLALVHRCMNGPSPKVLQGLFVRNKEMGYDNTQGAEKLHIFTNQTEWGQRSFAGRRAWEGNLLPSATRQTHSSRVFRKLLHRSWLDPSMYKSSVTWPFDLCTQLILSCLVRMNWHVSSIFVAMDLNFNFNFTLFRCIIYL